RAGGGRDRLDPAFLLDDVEARLVARILRHRGRLLEADPRKDAIEGRAGHGALPHRLLEAVRVFARAATAARRKRRQGAHREDSTRFHSAKDAAREKEGPPRAPTLRDAARLGSFYAPHQGKFPRPKSA